jgi:hypothetical protein
VPRRTEFSLIAETPVEIPLAEPMAAAATA